MVKSNLSFSLIEIIVVIAIIAVVTSMGFANFRRQQSDQQLKAETRKMADMISLARKKASVSDTSPCVAGLITNDKIKKYEFLIKPSTKTYEVFPECATNATPERIKYTIQSNDILIITPAVESSIFFYPRLMTETTTMTVNIKNNVTNRCCQIDINAAGVIKEIPCAECPAL